MSVRRAEKGFSIVELMVGMVISLIGIIVIMQVYQLSEGRKRSVISGGDAQNNGAMALYMLQRDVQQAGYGFANVNVLNCSVRVYNDQRTPSTFTWPSLAPVVINPAGIPVGDANTDVIQITYGNADALGGGVSFKQQSGASANYQVANRSEFVVGDMVIAAQSGLDCTLAQITDLPASGSCGQGGGTGQTDVIIHNSGNFKDPGQNCSMVQSHWNKPGGLDVTYTSGRLFNLGRLPSSRVYAVRNGNLTMCDYMAADCTDATKTNPVDNTVWVPVANNVVGLQAQYGQDTSAPMDMVVDTYNKTTPTTGCGYARAPVVRLAIAARSTQYEKTAVTTASPTWLGGILDVRKLPNGSANPDWQNYRYRAFETTIPLRNIVWMGGQPGC